MGANLANLIDANGLSINDYLNKIKVNPNSMYLQPITPIEIHKFIDKLPSKTSSGYDGISNKLLKGIKFTIIAPLTKVFNLSISTGKFPENMKLSEVILLFKRGAMDLMVNYRPISPLITISKLLEKCMYKLLYNFINKNNIFYSKQYSFRSNHSCEQAIQDLCGHLISNKEDGFTSIAVFLDLSKAFDTLSHDLLLRKLNIYGIRGHCNDWFRSYISNRMLQVKCKTLRSNSIAIDMQ